MAADSAPAAASTAPIGAPPPLRTVPFGAALRFWLKLGFISFGGPSGQIAIMHEELVEKRRWIGEQRFLHALAYCTLLPGPEAQQLATYIGWLLHRGWGGFVAGALFVLPGALLMALLSWIWAAHGDLRDVGALFYGLRAAVVAVVAMALLRLWKKALANRVLQLLALAAFLALFLFAVPFPAVVVGAGLVGLLGHRFAPHWFAVKSSHGPARSTPSGAAPAAAAGAIALAPPPPFVIADDGPLPAHATPSLARALRVLLLGLLVWFGPLLLIAWWRGGDDVLTTLALFFSKAACVTFGGAYAVLAYLQQAAVDTFGWMTAPEMLDGLGLAESTPGPLILVTQFVGYVAGHRTAAGELPGGSGVAPSGELSPALLGLLGAAVTTWATFAPCFLWIFLGAPYVERTRGQQRYAMALAAISAAVVGVVANLACTLSLHTLFATVDEWRAGPLALPLPRLASLDLFAAALAAAAFFGMQRRKWNLVPVVLVAAALGWAWRRWGT
ncbi:MAG: chromate efflux transporter [Planctomycetes bacterium]|nr:chromate efflux transporter [Planctomycetota bacterium]